ncbi:ParB/Srx family N-terminal domain-containing protein [Nocardia sp. alder85J]|uniref:ParB/Srx family N-terminal domain-containing protein n=1 Tax=Nocardia sp. alder85J TaxID=2862949 RepID=UPI00225A78E6|nr:ParB/Srx family N-terminal domain-containing protein [Nocardia sp. alder85J]MCX4099123.1 ParB/Srx family N-terminal domain-containing protein [Nocardia sp. alder85J]
MTTIEAPASTAPAEQHATPAEQPAAGPTPVPLPADVAAALRAAIADRIAKGEPARVQYALNPNHVDFGANVRDDAAATITPEYVASIKRRILQTPTAYLRDDNIVQVIDGQRRTLGARAAGLTTIDYLIGPMPEGTADARRATEIVDQVEANEERVNLTRSQVYAAQEELAGLNLPAPEKTKALRHLGIGAKEAKAMRTLNGAGKARDSAISGDLDLLQAAQALEFEDDPGALHELTIAARRGTFDGALVRLRKERQVRARRAEIAAPYAQRGFRILTHYPYESERKQLVPIEELRTPEGAQVTEADIAAAQWAVYVRPAKQTVHATTGEPIDEDDIDDATYEDPDRDPAEGKHHARDVRVEEFFRVDLFCHDPKRAGLRKVKETTASGRSTARTAAIINAEARDDTDARRAFVAEWLKKTPKTVPTDMQLWRLRLEGAAPEIFKEYTARTTAATLLGIPTEKFRDGTAFDGISVARAQMIGIGLAMGAIEGRMQPRTDKPHYWHIALPQDHVYSTVDRGLSKTYLLQLISLGYVPGIAERLTLAEITVDQAVAEITAKKAAREGQNTADTTDD